MIFGKKSFIAASMTAALLVFSGCGGDGATTDLDFNVSVIHVNDHHSNLDESAQTLTIDSNQSYEVKIGGMPRVITLINELQKSMTNPVTIHAGDALQGTMYYSIFKYEADAEMMNFIKWDSFTIGNHEFDDGDENLAGFISKLSTKVISSNIEVPTKRSLRQIFPLCYQRDRLPKDRDSRRNDS